MSNLTSYTTSQLDKNPALAVQVYKRALAGNPTVIEDKITGKRIALNLIPKSDMKDPWGEPPKEVLEQWEKEAKEFDELDRKERQPRFKTGEEMVAHIMNKK